MSKNGGNQWTSEFGEDLDAPVAVSESEMRVSSYASLGAKYNERPQESADATSEEDAGGSGVGIISLVTVGTRLRKETDGFAWGGTARSLTAIGAGIVSGQVPLMLRSSLPQEWRDVGVLTESAVLSINGSALSAVGADTIWNSGSMEQGFAWARGTQKVAGNTAFGNRFALSHAYSFPGFMRSSLTIEEGYLQNNNAAAYPFIGIGTHVQAGLKYEWGNVQFFSPVKFQYDFSPEKTHLTTIGPGFRAIHRIEGLGNVSASVRDNVSYTENRWASRIMIMGLFSTVF